MLCGPWGWKALPISSFADVHAGLHPVLNDPPHLRPSLENQLEVAEAFKLFPIHRSVHVLVGRFHKGLQEYPTSEEIDCDLEKEIAGISYIRRD